MAKTYLDEVKEEILVHLTARPYTIQDLVELTQKPYTTIQQVHKQLRDEGRVVRFDKRTRNARYTISATNNGPNAVIPELKWKSDFVKASTYPRNIEGIQENFGVKGAGIIEVITEILTLAEKVHTGTPLATVELTLNRLRARLHTLISSLEDIRYLGTQVLEIEKFWNPVHLEKFPNDPAWEDFVNFKESLTSE